VVADELAATVGEDGRAAMSDRGLSQWALTANNVR
jgi:hypothetical protein